MLHKNLLLPFILAVLFFHSAPAQYNKYDFVVAKDGTGNYT
ncbi:MAG: hypothetical protein JWN76_817, partial [Chitinophagaceae bacterium]|nr:hypothetical protein [Chitinophagaceae bacterium]